MKKKIICFILVIGTFVESGFCLKSVVEQKDVDSLFELVGECPRADVEKFIKVTGIAVQRIEQSTINRHLFSLLQSNVGNESNHKIALPTQHGLQFILPADILYCQSSGNYTKFFTKDGKTILVSRQLGEFEKLLSADDFHRIHDQYIVRLQYIKEYIRGRGGELIMENNDSLPVSANRKDAFLHRFEKWLRKG